MQYNFTEVSIKGVKKWKEDGKNKQKTKKFFQTLNPYNRNSDGDIKTRAEILKEITKERDEWLAL
ncbi:hypothetical protein Q4503_16415 [Colwellia sp. 6_MG-2023]|uniref:hypothetical protein n=1 Tax=Colwellia sp. 6_MG-2023 TaxID=3062676 RepID=UPI0026E3D2BC|nr:hypothetical protein [Colwellia sp. 6_MG-2023]MDO6489280.1 hypothetical protein [Colwellia sp. 6_MG-2023]